MTPKLPWLQFYPGDWLKDPKLSLCCAATRGIWIDAIAAMHESNRSDRITGTCAQLARVCRCSESDMQAAIEELTSTEAANVRTNSAGLYTLICRRLSDDLNHRQSQNQRQAKHRLIKGLTDSRKSRHASVTSPSPGDTEPETDSGGSTPHTPEAREGRKRKRSRTPSPLEPPGFVSFWNAYPSAGRVDRKGTCARWIRDDCEALVVEIMAGLAKWKASARWVKNGGEYVCAPLVFINQRRWEADPPPATSPAASSEFADAGLSTGAELTNDDLRRMADEVHGAA